MNVTSTVINLTSDDPTRLSTFYRDVVGLSPLPEMGEFALALSPECSLLFDAHSDTHGQAKEPSRVLLSLFVEDVVAERKRIEAAGIEFSRKEGVEFWGGIISTFNDPDGNYCQIIQFDPSKAGPENGASS